MTPPELVEPSNASYPDEARAQSLGGTVKLLLTIDTSGKVEAVSVGESPHALLEQAAVSAARKLRFRPARMGEVPVACQIAFEYRFEPPPPVVAAQPGALVATVRGLVRARGRRTPVAAAHLESSAGVTQTGPDGRFTLAVPEGLLRIRVSAAGFLAQVFTETVKAGDELDVIYSLDPQRVNPYETIVRDDRERTEVSRVTLHDQELHEVPGTMGDPFRVIMLMPGVGTVLSGVAYPVVRGSSPAATGYFLDGIQVPLLFHLFLGPAVVHPDFLETVNFYPGAPPPEYGRLLGGVIDGRTARPREDQWHGSFYADLINAGGFVEYPVQSTGTSFSVAGRLAYTAWLTAIALNSLAPDSGQKIILNFWDYQTRVEQTLAGGKLRLFVFGSSDSFGFEPDSAAARTDSSETAAPASQIFNVSFHRADLRYRHSAPIGEYELGVTWGTERISYEGTLPDSGNSQSTDGTAESGGRQSLGLVEQTYGARAGWKAPLSERLRIETGVDAIHRRPDLTYPQELLQAVNIGFGQSSVPATFVGAWTRFIWEDADKRWTVAPGLRFDNFHANNGSNHAVLEPRISARYQLIEPLAVKAGAGLFHQQPVTLLSLPLIDTAALLYGLQEGAQLSVGAEWKILSGLDLSAEVYFDPLFRTFEMVPAVTTTGIDSVSAPKVEDFAKFRSRGYAYGLELLLRHPLGGSWFGWIAYSYQRSSRLMQYAQLNELGETTGWKIGYLPFTFDQTHLLNAVVGYKFAHNWSVGVTVHYNSGRPEAGWLTSITKRKVNQQWVEVADDQVDRLPGFFRVDLRASKSWAFDLYAMELYLDVLNVTMQSEIVWFNYTYPYESSWSAPGMNKTPTGVPVVIPILGLKATY